MAVTARRLAINPYGDQYPDDNTIKEIVLQADGLVAANPDDRHVLIRWTNGTDDEGNLFTQIIHLSGGPGNYHFHTPQVKIHVKELDTLHVLGDYTREQRNKIIILAKAIQFNKKSHVNNCQTWMRDLLAAMVNDGLLSSETFDKIDVDVPLKKRIPELPENSV